MIIDDEKAIELLKEYQRLPEWVSKAREYDKKLNALVNGKDVKDLIVHIQHIEDSKKAVARKRYARGIKDLNDKLLRPIDNIYSATGGSKQYNIPGEQNATDVLKAISKVRDNKSIEAWLKTYWVKPLLHGQPNGLLFLEWKDSKAYPTFKSIGAIRCYKRKGQNIDWVIFEPEKTTRATIKKELEIELPGDQIEPIELWRIVDDSTDRRYIKAGNAFTPVAEMTFDNPFKECPGIICSDTYDFNCEHQISPIHSIVEVQEEYLADQSIKTIFKFKHGFPTFWRYAIICPKCQGRGKIGNDKCADCDGKGYYANRDITDEAVIPIPQSSDQVKIAPDIAGFVAPDITTWNQYNAELKLLSDGMYETHWGSQFIQQENQTATGRFIDVQPVKNRLNNYADVAQWVEWQLTEWIAKFKVPTISANTTVSTIIYGRNYLIESPDEILNRYQTSKEKGDPITILDRLFIEFLTTKFKNDPENLKINLTKFQVEPYPHYSIETVSANFGVREAQKKMMFADWWTDLNYKEYTKEVEVLEKQFEDYINEELGEIKSDSKPLAIELGVGGTQALQSILSDPAMTPESKRATIEILFGLTPEQSARMVPNIITNQNNQL
jgi:hypothetical protein